MTEQAHMDALKRSAWGTAERDLTWRYLRPHWRRLTAVVGMAFASSGMEMLRMGLILGFLGTFPIRAWPFGPWALPNQKILVVSVVVVSVVLAALDWWRRHVSAVVQRDFTESLRSDVCMTMLRRPLDWFTANPAGQASYLLNGQVGRFSTLVPGRDYHLRVGSTGAFVYESLGTPKTGIELHFVGEAVMTLGSGDSAKSGEA